MKDLARVYLALASALERSWTSKAAKRQAAVLLRNAAIQTPHCHFCGVDSKLADGQLVELYESRYTPKARICKGCALAIAEQFKQSAEEEKRRLAREVGLDYRRDTTLGPRRSYEEVPGPEDYRRDTPGQEARP